MSVIKIAYPDSSFAHGYGNTYDPSNIIKCPICEVEFSLGDLFRDGLMEYILEMNNNSNDVEYDIDIIRKIRTEKHHFTTKIIEKELKACSIEIIDLTLTMDEVVEEGFVFPLTSSQLSIKRHPIMDDFGGGGDDNGDDDEPILKRQRESGNNVFDAIILE